jgi:hypothetical protein
MLMKIKVVQKWLSTACEVERLKKLTTLKLVSAWMDMAMARLQSDDLLSDALRVEMQKLVHVSSVFNDLKLDVIETFAKNSEQKKKGNK